jgi:hypothetical protein
MKNYQLLFRYIEILALLIIGCFISGCVFTNSSTFSPLSKDELQKFVTSYVLNPLAVSDLSDATIILHQRTDKKVDCYIEQMNEDTGKVEGGLYGSTLGMPDNDPLEVPVSVIYRTYGMSEFVCVTINNEIILQKAEIVEVIFEDGSRKTIKVNGSKGYILFREGKSTHSSYKKVNIYGADLIPIVEKTPYSKGGS